VQAQPSFVIHFGTKNHYYLKMWKFERRISFGRKERYASGLLLDTPWNCRYVWT
jgi:hypothetical protein